MSTALRVTSFIQLDETAVRPGDEMIGVIHIEAQSSIEATQLFLVITSEEKTRWSETESSDDGPSHTEWFDGHQVPFQHSVCIHDFGGVIEPGQHSIPIRTRLPTNMIPSFSFQLNALEDHSAYIRYSLEAKLSYAPNFTSNKVDIWVTNGNYDPRQIHHISTTFDVVINRRLSGKYYSYVNVKLDKNTYFLDEKIRGSLEVDNTKCKRRLEKIRCTLTCSLSLRSDRLKSTTVPCTKFLAEQLVREDNSSSRSTHTFEMDLTLVKGLWMQPTINSRLIDCLYQIDILLFYTGFMTSAKYQCLLPVKIINTSAYSAIILSQ
jgi:hypothetical protein